MGGAAPIGALLIAAVFSTAGIAKLFDLTGSRRAVAAFGVPERLSGPFGTLLPLAEVAIAGLLIVGVVGPAGLLRAGALAATTLLTMFCLGIALNLVRGRAPECHCFGQLHSAPASGRTLARNGALLTVAAFVGSGGALVATTAAALAAAGLVSVAIAARSREHIGPPALEGLRPGTRAPEFELPALHGARLSLAELVRRGRPVLLVFTDPNCGPCIALAPEIAGWQREHVDDVTIAVIEKSDSRHKPVADEYGRRDVLLQSDREVADAYVALGTPSAVLIGLDGTVASRVAAGGPAIKALLAGSVPGRAPPEAAMPPAPRGASLVRREFLARVAAAWASTTGLLVSPASAQLLRRCRYERCGDRCCPRKAKCRRRGGRRVCICRDGRRPCGGRCCPRTFVCDRRGNRRRRRCVCPEGYIACAGRCVRARTDPRHCGRCGRECPRGTVCVDGRCVGGDGSGSGSGGSGECDCRPGKTCCEGQCTDLNTSQAHCGKCGNACPQGKTCCEGDCHEVENDPRNCGGCGKRCASDEVCSGGECRGRCPRGRRNCGGRCVDASSDRDNCGRCGVKCGEGYACCNGSCCDYNSSTCCPTGCTNTALDDENCGGCGNVCGPNSYCRFGVCTCPVEPCP